MKRMIAAAALAWGLGLTAAAADSLEEVQEDFMKLQRSNRRGVPSEKLTPLVDRCFDLAEDETRAPALQQAARIASAGGADLQDQWSEAVGILVEEYLDDDVLALVMMDLVRVSGDARDEANEHLATAATESSSKAVQGAACFAQAQVVSSSIPYGVSPTDEQSARMKTLLKKAVAHMPADLSDEFGRNVANMAKGMLFEMENLQIGCKAPDIVGEDLDGVAFKLSDYKGKVVMLDFWGDW